MKLIIDISNEMYDWLENGFPIEYDYVKLFDKVRQGEKLDNQTNGEIIKALFPNSFFDDYVNQWDEVESVVMDNEIYFDIEWWNAPYEPKGEQE